MAAIRRRVADRIAAIKERAGIETPVINEIALRAEILDSFEMPFPTIEGIVPVIAKGQAYGATVGRWYRVDFTRSIAEPSVVCVALARKGDVPHIALPNIIVGKIDELQPLQKLVDIPEIAELKQILKEHIPEISIPHISINVPHWNMQIPTADDFVGVVQTFFGDWGWANWIRDAIAWAIGNFEYYIWNGLFRPRALEKLNDQVLDPIKESFGNVRDGINDGVDKINERLETIRTTLNTKLKDIDDRLDTLRVRTNDRLGRVGSGTDERLETLRVGVNSRIDQLRTNTEMSVEDTLSRLFPRLYTAWGLRTDMAPTIVNIRNVTDTGFEFLSLGNTTAHWIAVGRR